MRCISTLYTYITREKFNFYVIFWVSWLAGSNEEVKSAFCPNLLAKFELFDDVAGNWLN